MKILKIVFMFIFFSLESFAQTPSPVLITLERPRGMMQLRSSKIELHADGVAIKTTTHYTRRANVPPHVSTQNIATLNSHLLEKTQECVAQILAVPSVEFQNNTCQDGPLVSYLAGKKRFAVKHCDDLQTLEVNCADSLVSALDGLELLSELGEQE